MFYLTITVFVIMCQIWLLSIVLYTEGNDRKGQIKPKKGRKRTRRLLSIVLLFATIITVTGRAFAAPSDQEDLISEGFAKQDYPLLNPDGSVSSVTISEIDRIIYERNRATLSGDIAKAEQHQQQLMEAGCRLSTPEEIAISGVQMDEDEEYLERGITSVTFTTTVHTVSVNGINYQVKRITAYPTRTSNLFHTAVIGDKTIQSSVASGVYKLLSVLGGYTEGTIGAILNGFITAYNLFSGFGFTPSTTVYGITASYTCVAIEQVSFYQYFSNGYWTPFGSSSYVQTGFSSTVFDVNYSGGTHNGLEMSVNAIQDAVYSPYSLRTDYCDNYYYDISSILSRYFTTYLFDKKSQVTSVTFFHNANGTKKVIKSLGMRCPTTTQDIH